MLNNMTRVQVIQVWFAAVALVAVAAMAFGATVKVGTGGMLLALSIVPAVLIFLLWPQDQAVTAGDVLRGTDRRP
jgi:hypothetical protein